MASTSQPATPAPEITATPAPQARGPEGRHEYSCVLCKQRKVRCDRLNPCSGCLRAGVSCLPGVRQPYKRRRKHSPGGGDLKKTRTSESPRGVYSVSSRTLDSTSSPEESRPQRQVPTFGQSLWTGLNDEFQDPRATKSSSEDDTLSSAEYGSSRDPSALLFSAFRNVVDLRELHPPPMQAFMLWQAFLQNVNPMSKVIHAPSVQPIIIEASKDFDTVPKPSVALLFAIYAAAIMSLKEEDCQTQFDAQKSLLLTRYFSACQQALAAASFMKSRNLVTLQAFVIFLLPARQIYDEQTFWLLAGVAMRLGLRLTGKTASDSPSDSVYMSQLRRRLWRQIVWIDGRSHHHIGLRPAFHDIGTFPLPENLNDVDLNPHMEEMPLIHKGPTEMTFCLCRYEVGEFMVRHGSTFQDPAVPVQEKDKLIDQFEAHMDENYLKHLDPAIPLHLMAEGGVRSATCKMRLMAHHPSQYPDRGKSIPQSERDILFQVSVKMVEYDVLGKSTKTLDNFSWHIDNAFQIDAFVFMLIASRTQDANAILTNKAWQLVSDMYEHRPSLLEDTNNELYAAVRELTLHAWEAREANIAHGNLEPIPVPEIIATLRERKAMKAMPSKTSLANPAAPMSMPPGASALHQLAGVATQVDSRNGYSSMGYMYGMTPEINQSSFQPGLDQQFDSIFRNLSGDMDAAGPVDWDYWDGLLERNNVFR
ncbi:hypothetical protein N8I77_001281 [Diaporthe amygdali]|uniref:Zn(2)-C6 fungal-type domain-containing protein n=1 Tax=Phomopsis amygdali TaxID=1214568 RepID=A0AAD9SRC0_PHOAM|nr:hypothetical protein N8I77_001281 [Diaporthe amygdali]